MSQIAKLTHSSGCSPCFKRDWATAALTPKAKKSSPDQSWYEAPEEPEPVTGAS